MSVSVDPRSRRPADQARAPERKPGMEDHTWLLFLGVLIAVVLVFVAMIVITALAGGDGFPS